MTALDLGDILTALAKLDTWRLKHVRTSDLPPRELDALHAALDALGAVVARDIHAVTTEYALAAIGDALDAGECGKCTHHHIKAAAQYARQIPTTDRRVKA
jgi:hypothetical protein